MNRIFVTGGSGFIGTNLVQYLVDNGHQVVNFDIASPRNKEHQHFWILGDVLDEKALSREVEKNQPEYFIHLAARTDLDGKNLTDYKTNTDGVLNVVSVVAQSDSIKKVLFASSRLVCKIGYLPKHNRDYLPTTFYGESKVIGEGIVHDYADKLSCSWAIIRPTSIWGPWFDTPYKEFFFTVLHSLYIHPKGMRILKSFGYVGNTVSQIWALLTRNSALVHEKTLYLCDYPPIEVQEWATLIAEKNGNKKPYEVPLAFLRIIAMAGDLLKKIGYPVINKEYTKNNLSEFIKSELRN